MSATTTFSRRHLLKAAGATLGVPLFLRQAFAQPTLPRLFLLMQTNGTHQPEFWPSPNTFNSRLLAPLLGDPALAPKTTVIKGIYNRTFGPKGTHHDDGFSGLYSGYKTIDAGGTPLGGGISIDQHLRKTVPGSVPFPTIHCGVFASYRPFNSNRLSFSYLAAGQQVPCERDAVQIYARLFGNAAPGPGESPSAGRTAAERRLAQRRSVLDLLAKDLAALERRLGPEERRKLDVHSTAVRELEARLAATAEPPKSAPSCRAPGRPPAPPMDPKTEDPAIPGQFKAMLELVAVAAACNLTRIVTFQFGKGGEHFRFGWLGIDRDGHDDIAHRDSGVNPQVTADQVKIGIWHTEQVAGLARALDAIPEGNGTVLDQSLVVWGNELATGPHGRENIPVVFLGRAGGRLRRTGQLVDRGPQEYHRLGATLLNVMGQTSAGFGEEPACGTLEGVEI